MLVIKREPRLHFKQEMVLFAEDYMKYSSSSEADIIKFSQSRLKSPDSMDQHTLHIDLTKSEDEILTGMNKNTRHQINQSVRINDLSVEFIKTPTQKDVDDFISMCNSARELKNLDSIGSADIQEYFTAGRLMIAIARDYEGRMLCIISYIYDDSRIRGLYLADQHRHSSDTVYKNLVGRASRYLHWKCMLEFKKQGFSIYDFGGLRLETDNEQLKNVDRYKLSFGGTVVTEYNFFHANSIKGKLAYKLMRSRFIL